MSKKLRIQSFRSNDLNIETGKQIEFGRSWCEDFFEISPEQSEVTFNLVFNPLCGDHMSHDKKVIELKLSNVTGRGDRKAYKNGNNGYSQLKDFFVTDLKLTEEDNLSDYFALYKISSIEYKLFYVPKLLYSNFVSLFNDNTLDVKCQKDDASSREQHDKDTVFQQIYYGAPGTGKSHTINEKTEDESVIRTTFHPDSDYSTFVGAYKPTMGLLPICDELGTPLQIMGKVPYKEQIIYEFVDQAFLQAYVNAWKYYAENSDAAKKQYLVIEEINRGNCAQIFGDLFQLLDRNDYGFSVYPINADKDMKKQLEKAFKGVSIDNANNINKHYKGRDVVKEVLNGDILLLPDNLYIWATMNTSDQSLFPIDSAFKRRWEWQYMPIGKGFDENGREIKWAIEGATKKYDWWSFLEKINAQVGEATQSEDKKLGFFFCKATNGTISAEKFVGKVIFYLWNDVFKNNGFEGPIFKDVDGTELSFGKFYKSDAKGNAIVQKDKVELFLNNLGVSIVGETEAEDEKLEAAITGGTVDRSKYTLNGSGRYGKSDLGRTIMEKFINEHPELTFDQLKQTFPDSMLNNIPGPGLIVKEDENLSSYSRYYVSGYTSSDGIKYHIYKQWTIGNVPNIIRFAESQNWSVEKL